MSSLENGMLEKKHTLATDRLITRATGYGSCDWACGMLMCLWHIRFPLVEFTFLTQYAYSTQLQEGPSSALCAVEGSCPQLLS